MPPVLLGFDLGRTSCRVRVATAAGPGDGAAATPAQGAGADPAATPARDDGPACPDLVGGRDGHGTGFAGLTEPGGADDGLRALQAALDDLPEEARPSRAEDVAAVVVGAAGAIAARAASRRLCELVARTWPAADVAVGSDAVVGHAGHLGGRAGVVLMAGTGAVAVGLGDDGTLHRTDGWGHWLGDRGSGAWVGQRALRAVLRAHDLGEGPTPLTARVVARLGPLDGLPDRVPTDGTLPRWAGALVPDVVAAEEEGDPLAGRILDLAADAWVESVVACSRAAGTSTVCLDGGLSGVAGLRIRFEQRVPNGLTMVPSSGDALVGALLLTRRADLPHEGHLVRRAARTNDQTSTDEPRRRQ